MTLQLKQTLVEAGIPALMLANDLSYSQSAVSIALNHGRLPRRRDFKSDVEQYLNERGIVPKGIWTGAVTPVQKGQVTPANQTDDEINLEVAMLSQNALRHFKLFRNPFLEDVRNADDVYMNAETRYVLAAMRDAARHQGILSVIGDSGAGKSILRRMLIEDLKKDGDTSIIVPRIFDKTRITAAGLCEAIIADISSENPKRSLEAKARQVERLLRMAAQGGQRHVLLIEEAHDLTIPTLKYLKRFWEMEDGFNKLLGIVLVGQNELKEKLNERRHYDLREFIRRCMVVELGPLSKDIKPYLVHKFKRAGGELNRVMDKGAVEAILKRLTREVRGVGSECLAYPLAIHNLLIRAMNAAADLGETKVTAEIVQEV